MSACKSSCSSNQRGQSKLKKKYSNEHIHTADGAVRRAHKIFACCDAASHTWYAFPSGSTQNLPHPQACLPEARKNHAERAKAATGRALAGFLSNRLVMSSKTSWLVCSQASSKPAGFLDSLCETPLRRRFEDGTDRFFKNSLKRSYLLFELKISLGELVIMW